MSISELLDKILGKIEPYGDTTIDEERYRNIPNYDEALDFILKRLKEAAKLKDRQEYSIQKIAIECEDILNEYEINH